MKPPSLYIIALATCFLCHVIYSQVTEEEVKESHRKYADLMKHDGKKRIKEVDGKNIKTLLKKNDVILVYFWIDNNKESEKLSEQDITFLETVAQALQDKKVVIGTCEVMKNQEFALSSELKYTGMIKIFNRGKIQTYGGQRSADVLIPYIFKMLTSAIVELKKKGEKKNYDKIDLVKIITYMEKGSKEYQAFSEASYLYQPMIPFFVITDAKLAKIFHLKKLNAMQIIKPFEKSVSYSRKGKMTYESIVKFIEENKKERLTKMRLENLHEVWAIDFKGYLVPIFANVKTEEGTLFFSKCKKLSKQYEKNVNLSFVWIEPEPFPAMIEYWRRSFEIDPLQPKIGVIDIHTQKSAWFEQRNDLDDQDQFKEMQKWLKNAIAGKIEFKLMKTMEKIQKENTNKASKEESQKVYEKESEMERDEL